MYQKFASLIAAVAILTLGSPSLVAAAGMGSKSTLVSLLVSVSAAQDHDDHGEHGSDSHADDGHASGGHGAGDQGGGQSNPLVIDPELVGFTIIVFLILLVILKKFAWGPVVAALDKREEGIAHEIDEAKRSNVEAKQMLAEYESRLQHAAVEVKELIDQARRDADVQKSKILAEAQDAARAEKDRALREIEAAKNDALGQLAGKSVDTALALASQIVQRQLSGEEHTKLIREALDMLPSKN